MTFQTLPNYVFLQGNSFNSLYLVLTAKKEIEKLKKGNNEFMLTLANDALEFGQIEKENDALKKKIELLHNRQKHDYTNYTYRK